VSSSNLSNQPRSPSRAAGEDYLLQQLEKRGFHVLKTDVHVPVAHLNRGPRCDFLMGRGDKQFAVELKVAHGFADWLFHWVARPILVLQALRRLHKWEPLLALCVDSLESRGVQRFKAQAAFYAPALWWLLADGLGNVVAHLPGGDEEQVQQRKHADIRASGSARYAFLPAASSPKLSFGDLGQWLLKVWLLAPTSLKAWGGPRGPIPTLMRLARLAGVAPPLVYRWAAAMQRSEYLTKWRRIPLLRNGDGLLSEWRGRYRITDNKVTPCDPLFRTDASFHPEFLRRLRGLKKNAPPYAITGHLACREYRLQHSEARSVQLYVKGDPSPLLAALQLVPSENPAAPVVFLSPRHERCVWSGVAQVDGLIVCDIFQVYLDLYHLPDRGLEQAEFVYEQTLKRVLGDAVEPRGGV